MKPFMVWITFRTPVILSNAVTLDAIAIGELALHLGNDEAIRTAPFRKTQGVPHASQIYLVDANRMTTLTKVARRSAEAATAPLNRVGTTRTGRAGTLSLSESKFHQARTLRKLRQGIGRALRWSTDRTTLWILDPRFPIPDSMVKNRKLRLHQGQAEKHLDLFGCIPYRFRSGPAPTIDRASIFRSTQ
jgi:hypothetical protein